MLKELSFDIRDLPTDYDSIEEIYFRSYKEVQGNTNITIEEFRGSNVYNIFNACILVKMKNNQFLSNFIPEIVNNSIEQNEIQNQIYSGNTTLYMRKSLKEVKGVINSQVLDVNSDSSLPKSTLAVYIKGNNIDNIEVANKLYDRINEGVATQGSINETISRLGFSKDIKFSLATEKSITLTLNAQISQNWNDELYSNEKLKELLVEEWNKYYDFQKMIQPLEFCKLDIFGDLQYTVSYNGSDYNIPFAVNGGDYLTLTLENITLNITQ